MPWFSKRSLSRLVTCHPALQELFRRVIVVIDCSILCGFRDQAEQSKLFKESKSRVIWPNSKHNQNPSMAVDVAPYYSTSPHIRWDEESLKRWYYFGGIVLGIATIRGIKIRWGGDWDQDTYVLDQSFNDLPHFELIV